VLMDVDSDDESNTDPWYNNDLKRRRFIFKFPICFCVMDTAELSSSQWDLECLMVARDTNVIIFVSKR
ncbi:9564_t:CDS:2, partial [Ambispora leptoticha]